MKKIYFAAALLFLGFTSCTTSSDNNDAESTFIPLTATSAWVYDVAVDTQEVGRDSLFVTGTTLINGKTYQKLSTKAVPTGFYTSSLNTNSLRKDGDRLRLTGTTALAFSEFVPVEIALSDFIIFKENASTNTQLDAVSGTIEQEIQGTPLQIDYVLTSFFQESLSSFTVPGKESYSNVKVIRLVANLTVATTYLLPVLNVPVSINLLSPQDVIVSTHYYAEGVGMIYAKTNINFELNELAQGNATLPLPQQGSSTIEEALD